MTSNPAPVRALGEIAIRCANLPVMRDFYRDIVGLPILREFKESGICFFEIAKGHGGHTAVLALFASDAVQRDIHETPDGAVVTGAHSSLHHLALTVDRDAQAALCEFLTERGIRYNVENFAWTGWRGVFIRDPEGNTVEFVAGDPAATTIIRE